MAAETRDRRDRSTMPVRSQSPQPSQSPSNSGAQAHSSTGDPQSLGTNPMSQNDSYSAKSGGTGAHSSPETARNAVIASESDADSESGRERAEAAVSRERAEQYLTTLERYGSNPALLRKQLQWQPLDTTGATKSSANTSQNTNSAESASTSTGGAAEPTTAASETAAAAAASETTVATAAASTTTEAVMPGTMLGSGSDATDLMNMINVGGLASFLSSSGGLTAGTGVTTPGQSQGVEATAAAAAATATGSLIGLDPSQIFKPGDSLGLQSTQEKMLQSQLSMVQQTQLANQTQLLSAATPLNYVNNTAFISLKIRPLGAGPVELVTPCATYVTQDTLSPPVYSPEPKSISPFAVRGGDGSGGGGGRGRRRRGSKVSGKRGRKQKRKNKTMRTQSAGKRDRKKTFANTDAERSPQRYVPAHSDFGAHSHFQPFSTHAAEQTQHLNRNSASPATTTTTRTSDRSMSSRSSDTSGSWLKVKDVATGATHRVLSSAVHTPRARAVGAVSAGNVVMGRLASRGRHGTVSARAHGSSADLRSANGESLRTSLLDADSDVDGDGDGSSGGWAAWARSRVRSVVAGLGLGNERFARETRRGTSPASDPQSLVLLTGDSGSSSGSSSNSGHSSSSSSDFDFDADDDEDEDDDNDDFNSDDDGNNSNSSGNGRSNGHSRSRARGHGFRTQQTNGSSSGVDLMSDCVIRAVMNTDGTTSGVECMPTFSACPTPTALDSSTLWSVTRVPFSDVPTSSLFVAETMTNINYDMDYATVNTYPFVIGQMALRNFSPFEQFVTARARKSIVQSISFRWGVGITPVVNVAFADLPSVIVQPLQNLLNTLIEPVITFLEGILPGLGTLIADIGVPTASLAFVELSVPISFGGSATHTEATDISIAYSITAPPQSHVVGRGIAHMGRSSVPFTMDLARRVHVPAGVFGQLTGQVINYEYRIPGVYDGANLINTEFIVDTL